MGLTMWERPFRRRTWIPAAGLALAFLLGSNMTEGAPALTVLAIPWLWSLRWSSGLGGGRLALLSIGALVSMMLGMFTFGPASIRSGEHVIPGLAGFISVTSPLATLYALISLPRLAWRIQFSIRRIAWRLVASHLLAGLIPGILSILFLLLAAALYLSTYRGMVAERSLRDASQSAERVLARAIGGPPPNAPFGDDMPEQVLIVREEGSRGRAYSAAGSPANRNRSSREI